MNFSHDEFNELMKIPENKKCFDCNNKSCQWASINNGIFLCTNCSGIHRGLGVNNSYIRSIFWDNWTDKQIKFMKKGGNKQLKDLLNFYSYNIKSMSPDKFYKTKIMEFYRRYLKSKVEGIIINESPPLEEDAFKENFINSNKVNENKFNSVGSSIQNDHIDNNNNISLQDNVRDWMDKTYQGTKDTFNNLELGDKIVYAKNSLLETGNKIIDAVQIRDFVKKTNETFSYYFNWIMGNKNENNNVNVLNQDLNNRDKNNEFNNKNIKENIINDDSKENIKNSININFNNKNN